MSKLFSKKNSDKSTEMLQDEKHSHQAGSSNLQINVPHFKKRGRNFINSLEINLSDV